MTQGVHELYDLTASTEDELRRSHRQVGEHLYVHPHVDLEPTPANDANPEDFQVVFPMAGHGTRLMHVTHGTCSKHMLQIAGQPSCKYAFDLWRNQGFTEFCLLVDVSDASQSVIKYFGEGAGFGARIRYSVELTKLGTGGAVKKAIATTDIDRPAFLHYPDDQIVGYSAFPSDFQRISVTALQKGYSVIVICVPATTYHWGEVQDTDGKVVDFCEKPLVWKHSYTGVSAVSDTLFPLIAQLDVPEGGAKIERTVFREVARSGRMLKVLLPTEYWFPINDDLGLRAFEHAIQTPSR